MRILDLSDNWLDDFTHGRCCEHIPNFTEQTSSVLVILCVLGQVAPDSILSFS